MSEPTVILLAEYVGEATMNNDGTTTIPVDLRSSFGNHVSVYVRRSSRDLSIMEVHIARHDGLAQESLDAQNEEAEHHPLGPKEYWRSEMVGKYTNGADGHLMTDEEFETEWAESEED